MKLLLAGLYNDHYSGLWRLLLSLPSNEPKVMSYKGEIQIVLTNVAKIDVIFSVSGQLPVPVLVRV